jgi:HEAT repeat protein
MEALGRMAAPPEEDADPDEPARVPDAAALIAIASLAGENFSDARLRRAVAKAIGDGGRAADRGVQARLISSLSRRWSDDPSYAVRAECLRALGRLKAVDAIPLFDAGLRTESQHDQIRRAAIDAWKESRFPDAFSRVAAMTTPNHSRDARQAAIRAVGELAERDPERAFNLLAALINDRDMRTRRVAVEALLKLDDPRAIPTVDQWTDAARSRSDKAWGRELLRKHAEEAESETSGDGGSGS